MLFIHTTCKDIEEAQKLSSLIIEQGVGACVDYWPVTSCSNVDGVTTYNEKIKLLITTIESKLDVITKLIAENHSQIAPLIAGVDVRRINHQYKEWMMKVIK